MATLEKIRGKAGLLVGVIGVALLAFIVGDLLNSGHTFFRMNQDKVAVINGKKITVEEYQDQVAARTEEVQQQYGRLPEGAASYINQEVYDKIVTQALLDQEADKLGISVSKEELSDLLQGNNIVPQVQQLFTTPQGTFDKVALQNFLQNVVASDGSQYTGEAAEMFLKQRQMWLKIEKDVKEQRKIMKFIGLLSKAVVPNKLDLEAAYQDEKVEADFVYAVQPYASIVDSTVVISDSELNSLYNKRKENFKQDGKRSIKYFMVDIVPSEADYKLTEEKLNKIKDEFVTTNDMSSFLGFNTDVPYSDTYVSEKQMSPDVRKFVETAEVNSVQGPEFRDGSFQMYRLMAKTVAPDTLDVRVIAFPMNDVKGAHAKADSVTNVLKSGADFKTVVDQLAEKKIANGDEIKNMTDQDAARYGAEIVNASFNNAGGDFAKIETGQGLFLLQVTRKSASVAKAKVAQLVLNVRASSDTHGKLYNGISQYLATNNTLDKFESEAKGAGYSVASMDITPMDYTIGSINDGRQAVKWAFNADKGDVSEILTLDNKFLVLAVSDIIEAGYAPMKKVESVLRQELMADKKAEMIINSLKSKGANSLDAYAQAMNSQKDTARFVSFATNRIEGVGNEPVLCALAPYSDVNKLVGPVKGQNGVYVLSVYNKTVKDQPVNLEIEKQKFTTKVSRSIGAQWLKVLKDGADIENNLIKFF